MKRITWFDAAALLVWLLPVIYLLVIYQTLPNRVPLHFDVNGTPDRYGNAKDLFGVQFLLSGVALGVYLLMKFLPQIDPKKQAKYSAGTFQKMALGIVLFISAVNIIVLYSSANGSFKLDKILLPLLGLFFAFMGNIMHSIKPNYFAGIRTPWTLESEATWRATHRLAGKMWFWGGVLLAVLTFVFKGKAAFIIFMSGVAAMALVPVVYSFIYFKKHKMRQ